MNVPARTDPAPIDTRSRPGRVTGRLKQALDLMVFGDETGRALPYDEAARNVKITTRAMRKALEKPHVRQYLRQARQVFLASASATNVSEVIALRRSSNQMTRLGAARLIEEMSEEQKPGQGGGPVTLPGLVIMIVDKPAPAAKAPGLEIELKPVEP